MLPASDAIGLFFISSQADRYRRSFSPFAAANDTFRDALMVMASPVAGFRPSRSGRLLTVNLPKPGIATSSPFAAEAAIASKTAAIIAFVAVSVAPVEEATLLVSSPNPKPR